MTGILSVDEHAGRRVVIFVIGDEEHAPWKQVDLIEIQLLEGVGLAPQMCYATGTVTAAD